MRYWFSLLTIIILTGCTDFYCDYVIPLKAVERSPVCEEYNIEHVPYTSTYKYNDELVAVKSYILNETLGIWVKNKTEQTIKILWDEIVYVDPNGENHKVMQSGDKHITIVDGWYWHTYSPDQPLFPCSGHNHADISAKANKYKGSKVKILMPIVIGDCKYKYIFSFEVEGVTVIETKGFNPFAE